jgi:hypothetical protein
VPALMELFILYAVLIHCAKEKNKKEFFDRYFDISSKFLLTVGLGA